MPTVPPYSFVLDDPSDVSVEMCWFARPQLSHVVEAQAWEVTNRPTRSHVWRGRHPNSVCVLQYLRSSVPARFWSMEIRCVVKLYEPFPRPVLYEGLVSNVLGRVLLMPLFLPRYSTQTISHSFRNFQRSKFPSNCADRYCQGARQFWRRTSRPRLF